MNTNNYCIIMAGGVGSRFWPLSTTSKPKQFLDILNTGRSLLQQTFDRFSKVIPTENIYIVTNENYRELTRVQLPILKKDQILSEPAMRNTAPCIAYASYKILSQNPEANFIVAPSDHLICNEDTFLRIINEGLTFTKKNEKLLTIGIKPTRPETGYGYIQANTNEDILENSIQDVKTFTEKPNLELAKAFIESGEFFWNSGIFMWKGSTINKAMEEFLPDIAEKFQTCHRSYYTEEENACISSIYTSCKSISIDYGIMEKADNVCVYCSEPVGWSDLGTWGSLYEQLEVDENKNARSDSETMLYDCKNNIIKLPHGKIAVIQGLEGYIIAQSNNTLLICKKEEEQRIKQFVTDVKIEKGDNYI